MFKLLTTSGCTYYLESLIKEAKEGLYLVSPFIQLDNNLYERIKEANDRGIKIVVVFGKERMLSDAQTFFNELKNVSIYYHNDLHAKAYLNESNGIITSMNLYISKAKNTNREMGISFSVQENANVYQDCLDEIKSIIKSSQLVKKGTELKLDYAAAPLAPISVPKFEKTSSKTFHLADLLVALQKKYPQFSFKTEQDYFTMKLNSRYKIRYTYRMEVPFSISDQGTKNALRSTLELAKLPVRLYSSTSLNLMVYRLGKYKSDISPAAKAATINGFLAATEVIVQFLSQVKPTA